MKIKTLGSRIQLEIEEPKTGALNVTSMPTAMEYGTITDIGADVDAKYKFINDKKGTVESTLKVGDKVMFKAWAVDIIQYGDTKYYFLDIKTGGLCAVIE